VWPLESNGLHGQSLASRDRSRATGSSRHCQPSKRAALSLLYWPCGCGAVPKNVSKREGRRSSGTSQHLRSSSAASAYVTVKANQPVQQHRVKLTRTAG
jgi:hypothetical protein